MTDVVKLLLKAGDGGNGRVSFRREKYIPKGGPDGGDGGSGGNIIIRATRHKSTLDHLSHLSEVAASAGQPGDKRKKTGAAAQDTVVEVPVGTVIWQLAATRQAQRRQKFHLSRFPRNEINFSRYELEKEGQAVPPLEREQLAVSGRDVEIRNEKLADIEKEQLVELTAHGQEVLICQGGYGGRGNTAFKSSARTTPLLAEYGTPGEWRLVIMEQRLLADVGLVGFPNAGKSTLLSVLSKARPQVANYPFTTLRPHLGVVAVPERLQPPSEFVLADLPGLIAGASQGQGLGYTFLRHIEACQVLVYLLPFAEHLIGDDQQSAQIEQLLEQYQTLRAELREYDSSLLNKPSLIAINKVDLLPVKKIAVLQSALEDTPLKKSIFISGVTKHGVEKLLAALVSHLR